MVLPFDILRTSPKSSTHHQSSPASLPSPSTLAAALQGNPFKSKSREALSLPAPQSSTETEERNEALQSLASLFPDVQVEVLRELVIRYAGESRIQICVEQLLKYKTEWCRGRYSVPARNRDDKISIEDQFRTQNYMSCVKKTLNLEFRAISRSAIDAVLAEVNFSYANARPILQDLSNKSWRVALSNIFRKQKPSNEPPSCLFDVRKSDPDDPRLESTGSQELDKELHSLFLNPLLRDKVAKQTKLDHAIALSANRTEAEQAQALFECQCCCDDVTFEQITYCTFGSHPICYDCIRRTVQEALFGQGWLKSVNPELGTLRCIAPLTSNSCDGDVPRDLVEQATCVNAAGSETWLKFEERLATNAIHQSELDVVQCPFCFYAEAKETAKLARNSETPWRFRKRNTLTSLVLITILLNFIPLLLILAVPLFIFTPNLLNDVFRQSLIDVAVRKQTSRFVCQRPDCKRASCIKCNKAWHDPHICHEPLVLSLRTTVEAARTAAVKRTCPRCGTSFVKSSGCNKLTCVCGYVMCYICRKSLHGGPNSENEGYRHFCEHFRPIPGQQCTECQKCDLYKDENEAEMVRQAAEDAEREWREKEGMVGVVGLEEAVENVGGEDSTWIKFWTADWTRRRAAEWIVDKIIVVEG